MVRNVGAAWPVAFTSRTVLPRDVLGLHGHARRAECIGGGNSSQVGIAERLNSRVEHGRDNIVISLAGSWWESATGLILGRQESTALRLVRSETIGHCIPTRVTCRR